jgi:hypothetical protein
MSSISKIIYEVDAGADHFKDPMLESFVNTGKNYFNFSSDSASELSRVLRESNKFYRYKFPESINEYFFRYEEAPLFWISETPLNKYLKDFYRQNFPVNNGIDQYRSPKEVFYKWIFNKNEDEKKYFALSINNFIDYYNSRSNFLSYIYAALVSLYDKTLYNPRKAIDLFEKSREVIVKIKLNDFAKKELDYLLNIFTGFAHFALEDYELAVEMFKNALKLKTSGVTAKFYLTLADIKSHNSEEAEIYLKEVFNYDSERVEFAVENFGFTMFNFFVDNSVFRNIYYYSEFSLFTEKIENLLSLIKLSNEPAAKILSNKFEVFKIATQDISYKEDIAKKISFINRLLKKYDDSNNVLFLNIGERLKNNFLDVVMEIKSDIKNKYYSNIETELSHLSEEIKIRSSSIEKILQELENKKIELKNKLASTITNFEKQIAAEIVTLEDEIRNLHLRPKLNPQSAFKHAMVYDIILSFMVFLMGGCAGYSNNYVHDVSELKNLITISLFTGAKWGLITFLIGIILSAITAGFTLLERSNRRQSLLQSISQLKNEKERSINLIKKDFADKEAVLIQNFNVTINENKERIEQLKREKDYKEDILKKEAEKQIEEECKPYAFLLDEEIQNNDFIKS